MIYLKWLLIYSSWIKLSILGVFCSVISHCDCSSLGVLNLQTFLSILNRPSPLFVLRTLKDDSAVKPYSVFIKGKLNGNSNGHGKGNGGVTSC